MILENLNLELTKDELISMIKDDNPDSTDWSKEILLNIINSYRNFSVKQYDWILSKIKYIVNHNDKYKSYKKKIKNFSIEK